MSIERLNIIWPEWKLDKQLGEGSFGKVYKVIREGRQIMIMSGRNIKE